MEREFISWLKQQTLTRGPGIELGIGDDAAILNPSSFHSREGTAGIVISTDSITDGTHFDLNEHSLELIGRKAIAVNLSDMAAMAAWPVAVLISYTAPRSFELHQMKALFQGSDDIAKRYDVSIVGGDTNCSDGPLTIAVTVLGKPISAPIWLMNSAKPGDTIFVSGKLGGSILGRHLTFEPRLNLARQLSRQYDVHAATDVTDSLTLDLNALAQASGLGAYLDLQSIPVSPDAIELAEQTGLPPLHHALSDGEDFELLFTVDERASEALLADNSLNDQICQIGEMIERPGLWSDNHGSLEPINPTGYSH